MSFSSSFEILRPKCMNVSTCYFPKIRRVPSHFKWPHCKRFPYQRSVWNCCFSHPIYPSNPSYLVCSKAICACLL